MKAIVAQDALLGQELSSAAPGWGDVEPVVDRINKVLGKAVEHKLLGCPHRRLLVKDKAFLRIKGGNIRERG